MADVIHTDQGSSGPTGSIKLYYYIYLLEIKLYSYNI